jgi:hypothetical protein
VPAASPLGDSLGAATWSASTGCHIPLRVTDKGKKGYSPSERPYHRPGWLGRGARRACRHVPTVPSSAHASVNTRAAAGERGKRWGRKVGEADPWGPAVSEKERKMKRSLVGGMADSVGLLGQLVRQFA